MPLVDDGLGDLTYQVIGCAMRVHNTLGPGLREEHYEDALAAELANAQLPFEQQKPIEIHLGESQVGVVILDLLVPMQLDTPRSRPGFKTPGLRGGKVLPD